MEADSGVPRLLSQQEVAKKLGATTRQVRSWMRAGLIPTIHIGGKGRPRVSSEDYREMLRTWTVKPGGKRRPPRPPKAFDADAEVAKLERELARRKKARRG